MECFKEAINMEKSPKYKLNKEDGKKIGKGALIALGGALLTYVSDIIPMIDWGEYKPVVVAISGIIINFGWKFLKNNE